jgi:hypothetical protein
VTELNFRLRLRLIQKLGMSARSPTTGLWTLSRKFINSDAGFATMRANQAIIRANSAELYSASWRQCQAGPLRGTGAGPNSRRSSAESGRQPWWSPPTTNLIPKELSELIAARIPGQARMSCGRGPHSVSSSPRRSRASCRIRQRPLTLQLPKSDFRHCALATSR